MNIESARYVPLFEKRLKILKPRINLVTYNKINTLLQRRLIRYLIQAVVAGLLSRFVLPGGVSPAGIAFALIRSERSFQEQLFILSGIFVGILSTVNLRQASLICGSLLILFLARNYYFKDQKSFKNRVKYVGFWIVLRLIVSIIGQTTIVDLLKTGYEILACLGLTGFFKKGFAFIDNPLKISKFALFSAVLIVAVVIGGIQGNNLETRFVTEVAVALIIMITSFIGGGGVGAIMGIAIALTLGLTTGGVLLLIALYSVSGLLGGILKDLGRWGVICGASLGLYIILKQPQFEPVVIEHVIPWGIGMAAFVLVPKQFLSQVSNYIPEDDNFETISEKQRNLEEIVSSRLNELAAAFAEISKNFNEREAVGNEPKMDLYSMLDQVCTELCQHCNGYESCWGEHFYATYREMFDLIALSEINGELNSYQLKGRLSKSCFQQYKLVNTINKLLEHHQTNNYWQRKFEGNKLFLSEQLQGVSDFITSLAGEITKDSSFKAEIENKVKNSLNQIGSSVKDIVITSFGNNGLEIKVKKQSCCQRQECQCLIVPMISKLMEQEYMVWEKQCQVDPDNCAFCLIPKHRYEIKTAVCKESKDGNEFCGDSHALHELKDGYFAAILSDGMGHGRKAARESNSTVNILERLLDTGIDRRFAVKMVNSMMSLRSPEESFATVDLALIDLYSGVAEFLKIGAAATYVKRGRDVCVIESTSLPAGILNSVDVEKTVLTLQPGDLIVMVTDGIVDSKPDLAGKEEWLKRALTKVEVVGPEALAEYILNLARINQDGNPKDDMTVIVLQVADKNVGEEE